MKKLVVGILLGASAAAVQAQLAPISGVAQVAAGGDLFLAHSCVLTTNGGVQCWGGNSNGQLGDGTVISRSTPVYAIGLESDVAQVSTGANASCARKTNGDLFCWGSGEGLVPVQVATGVQSVSQGRGFVCLLGVGGGVQCKGQNFFGQLGDGSTTTRSTFADVAGLGSGVSAIASGITHSCAALTAGGVRCWGANSQGGLGDGTTTTGLSPVTVSGLTETVTHLALADSHSCARVTSGGVKCWGGGLNGQIGDGANLNRLSATDVSDLASGTLAVTTGSAFVPSTGAGFTSSGFSCALLSGGEVRCWGYNGGGQLGLGDRIDRAVPVAVSGLAGAAADIDASAGQGHVCATLVDGSLQCWGSNFLGGLGAGSLGGHPVPTRVPLAETVQALSGGSGFTCGLLDNATVRCWGHNADGQLGDGSVMPRDFPVATSGLPGDIVRLAGTAGHSCALVQDGTVLCWGAGGGGALGNGSFSGSATPVPVSGLGVALDIAGGGSHSCAVVAGGAGKCWGSDSQGRLGNGASGSSSVPVDVVGLTSGVESIAAGNDHSCAILTGGSVVCWGYNANGQLGDGTTTTSQVPVGVAGLPGPASALSLGRNHSCALLQDSRVACWGANYFGQLGLGDATQRLSPSLLPTLTNVSAIYAGYEHTCAIAGGGSLHCWGSNNAGQLGNGAFGNGSLPSLVVGMASGVTAVSAGYLHTCAVQNGDTFCWGDDSYGQLGDGVPAPGFSTLPAAVNIDTTPRHVSAGVAMVDDAAIAPSSSASGRFIAFQSRATNLGDDDGGASSDVFRVDTECVNGLDAGGAACERVVRASVDDGGAMITGDAVSPSISADGQLLVFVAEDAGVQKVRGESTKAALARRKGGGFGVYLRSLIAGQPGTFRMGSAPSLAARPQIAPSGNAIVFPKPNDEADPGRQGQPDIYVKPIDRSGGVVVPGLSTCVSCKTFGSNGAPTGEDADGESENPVVSADGTWVAWQTKAKNMLPATSTCVGTESREIMLRNLLSGVTQRVGAPASASSCGVNGSRKPSLDYSGRKLVFESSNALEAGATRNDVYLFDVLSNSVERVSERSSGSNANADSQQPVISGDGETIAFVSTATNLDATEFDTNAAADLFVYSTRSKQLKRLARTTTGTEADSDSFRPALSYSGSRIAFDSTAGNLTADSVAGRANVYERANVQDTDKIFAAAFE